MGMSLEDVLKELNELKNTVEYYLSIKGYTPTDIDNLLGDLETKLREVDEYVN